MDTATGTSTGRVVVIQFVTADGVIEDPDGSDGTPTGGWAFRHGPEVIAGDKFHLGESMEMGVLLFGRTTWQMFSTRWPGRTGEFPDRMNAARKVVATRSIDDVSAWNNSTVIDGDLADAVTGLRAEGDVVVIGSTSVVRALVAADLVDQYRLLVFPDVVGTGERMFPDGTAPVGLQLVSAEQNGVTVLLQYDVER